MKNKFIIIIAIFITILLSKTFSQDNILKSWPDILLKKANTAINANYLTTEEKNIVFYLNLVRLNPPLFAKTFLKEECGKCNYDGYYSSLLEELLSMKPVNICLPDKKIHDLAKSWATESGKKGITGHGNFVKRSGIYASAECISYGHNTALEVVLQLLIDSGVESLGHRRILLSDMDLIGISIQPHVKWKYCAVLDFGFAKD